LRHSSQGWEALPVAEYKVHCKRLHHFAILLIPNLLHPHKSTDTKLPKMDLYTTTANSPPLYPHEPLMYPTRLKITEPNIKYRLYAYPTPRPPNTLVQLQTQIPAIVSYVLGPTWRDELTEREWLFVPQSNWTQDEESAIALRMLRGGGALIDNSWANGQWWLFGGGFSGWLSAEQKKKYIYGWPEGGGVWVLRLPPLLEKHIKGDITIDEELDQMENWDSIEPAVFRDLDGSVHYGNLVKGETMEDFCGRLKNAGATFMRKLRTVPG
jgi:hypothetical protein